MVLSKFVEGVLSTFDKGDAVCAVLLDLSKAFDSMDREILLRQLEYYGLTENIFLLLKSYLTERNQYVNFG